SECATVVEIGLRDMVSSWGLLKGLADNLSLHRSYIGIDVNYPDLSILNTASALAARHGIAFKFICANDMDIDIEPTELLFIDSLHTYCHLSYELEKFSPQVSKYIALHDTSSPWGDKDDEAYTGDYWEYPLS